MPGKVSLLLTVSMLMAGCGQTRYSFVNFVDREGGRLYFEQVTLTRNVIPLEPYYDRHVEGCLAFDMANNTWSKADSRVTGSSRTGSSYPKRAVYATAAACAVAEALAGSTAQYPLVCASDQTRSGWWFLNPNGDVWFVSAATWLQENPQSASPPSQDAAPRTDVVSYARVGDFLKSAHFKPEKWAVSGFSEPPDTVPVNQTYAILGDEYIWFVIPTGRTGGLTWGNLVVLDVARRQALVGRPGSEGPARSFGDLFAPDLLVRGDLYYIVSNSTDKGSAWLARREPQAPGTERHVVDLRRQSVEWPEWDVLGVDDQDRILVSNSQGIEIIDPERKESAFYAFPDVRLMWR
jgi:hypothetical protein